MARFRLGPALARSKRTHALLVLTGWQASGGWVLSKWQGTYWTHCMLSLAGAHTLGSYHLWPTWQQSVMSSAVVAGNFGSVACIPYLLPRPDFSGFFKFLRTKGGYSLALCWDSKDLEKEELLQMSPS